MKSGKQLRQEGLEAPLVVQLLFLPLFLFLLPIGIILNWRIEGWTVKQTVADWNRARKFR